MAARLYEELKQASKEAVDTVLDELKSGALPTDSKMVELRLREVLQAQDRGKPTKDPQDEWSTVDFAIDEIRRLADADGLNGI